MSICWSSGNEPYPIEKRNIGQKGTLNHIKNYTSHVIYELQ